MLSWDSTGIHNRDVDTVKTGMVIFRVQGCASGVRNYYISTKTFKGKKYSRIQRESENRIDRGKDKGKGNDLHTSVRFWSC